MSRPPLSPNPATPLTNMPPHSFTPSTLATPSTQATLATLSTPPTPASHHFSLLDTNEVTFRVLGFIVRVGVRVRLGVKVRDRVGVRVNDRLGVRVRVGVKVKIHIHV